MFLSHISVSFSLSKNQCPYAQVRIKKKKQRMQGKIITGTCNYVSVCLYIYGRFLLCISSKMIRTHQPRNPLCYRLQCQCLIKDRPEH